MTKPEKPGSTGVAGKSNDPALQVLQTAKNRLEYLTANDWLLLTNAARQVTFNPDQVLIEKGKPTHNLFLLLKGKARVRSGSVTVSRVLPGEIIGEMAFLEGTLPSASVIADESVLACVLEWSTLRDLFEMYPHLASRFYRSLAVNLSRRLRKQISSMPAAAVD